METYHLGLLMNKGLIVRILMKIPTTGRGLNNQGSTLVGEDLVRI